MTAAARLAALERRANELRRTATPVPRWPTLGDLPTIRWDDPEAVAAITADMDVLTASIAATDAADWDTVQQLADRVGAASLSLYGATPGEDETPEQWRARLDRLPVACPVYVDRDASW